MLSCRKKVLWIIAANAIVIIIWFISRLMDDLDAYDLHYHDQYIILKASQDDKSVDELFPGTLVNLDNIKTRLQPKITVNDNILGVLLVTSYVGHDEVRAAHRQALPAQTLIDLGFIRIFLLAEIPSTEKFITQKSIYDENRRFKDILQGNFLEAYRNLTYKHIMGLKWAANVHANAKFIVKLDDDTVFNIYYLKYFLQNTVIGKDESYLAGYILDNKKAIRLKANKWYVSKEEYMPEFYPDYLSGWLYITNPLTAKQLVNESEMEPFFWIDDTWITGVLREKAGIQLNRLNHWFSANAEFLDCCIRDIKKLHLKCDYYVGPNGGDAQMIVEFTAAVRKCYLNQGSCFHRTENKWLNKTCVGQVKNIIGQHGVAVVEKVQL